MLDSIDHFNNISGQFEEYSSSSRIATTYKYAIDTEQKRNLFKRRQANEKRTIIYNEGKKKNLMMRSIRTKKQNGARKKETMNY